MNALVELPQNAVTLKDGHVIATSITVAEVFKKQHKDVLRTIRSLEIDEEFARRNFAPGSYLDKNGQVRPMVEITRDGFTLLGMGFSGREAMQFKVAYIQRFNEMESHLSADEPQELMVPLTDHLAQAEEMGELRDEVAALKDEVLGLYRERYAAQTVEHVVYKVPVAAVELMLRYNIPRDKVAEVAGRSRMHIRVINHNARKAGRLQ